MSIGEIHNIFISSKGISTDSRNIWEGCIYLSLKGDRFNGNDFALQSLEEGAEYAIIDEQVSKSTDHRLIRVDSGLATLQNLAKYHRVYCGWPVLAITGSNGKTTTKELIGRVLQSQLNALITEGNLNNHIGVPLTLLNGTKEHEVAVIEMGASHQGDIDELCKIADPDIGLITNIGKAHLEGMGGVEGVFRTKTELFNYIRNKAGKVLLNMNEPMLTICDSDKDTSTYGTMDDHDIRGEALVENGHLTVNWKLQSDIGWRTIKTNLVGTYNLDNVLSAITVGIHFGIETEDIKATIESYIPTNNRSEFVESGTNQIVWDAYNANPSSMAAALKNIVTFKAPRVVLILGEMKEVGPSSHKEHENLVSMARAMNPLDLYLVGSSFKDVNKLDGKSFDNVEDLSSYIENQPITDSLILVKGSRSNQLEKLRGLL